MAIATAIVGSAAIGAVGSSIAADKAADSAEAGAAQAADATVQATQLQVAELQRQFDAQMQLLGPLIQNQYGANSAFAQLLGFDGYNEETGEFASGFSFSGGPEGFADPNLNPQQLGADNVLGTELGEYVFGNTLAGASPEQDLAIQRAQETQLYGGIDADSAVQQARGSRLAAADPTQDLMLRTATENLLAAPSLEEDERFNFARDTAVVGDTFETSPGYQFAVEEAMKEVDRRNSVGGGNYGGRALLEAQRRAEGEASQEYYNWVGARNADLARQDAAAAAYQGREAFDLGRLDSATQNYLARLGVDIGREDAAVADARRREELDVGRGDQMLFNYFSRLGQDFGRQEGAIANNQTLNEFDLRRQDQGYYNFLANLMGAGGVSGNSVGQAVSASGAAGAGTASAYGQQGAQLSSIYNMLGNNLANIGLGNAANINDSLQGGISNYLLMSMLGGI